MCTRFYLDDEWILSIPDPLIHDRDPSTCFIGFYNFGAPWVGDNNPWTGEVTCDQFMAPFDQDVSMVFSCSFLLHSLTFGDIPDHLSWLQLYQVSYVNLYFLYNLNILMKDVKWNLHRCTWLSDSQLLSDYWRYS